MFDLSLYLEWVGTRANILQIGIDHTKEIAYQQKFKINIFFICSSHLSSHSEWIGMKSTSNPKPFASLSTKNVNRYKYQNFIRTRIKPGQVYLILNGYDFRETDIKNENQTDLDQIWILSLPDPNSSPNWFYIIIEWSPAIILSIAPSARAIEFFVVRSISLTIFTR